MIWFVISGLDIEILINLLIDGSLKLLFSMKLLSLYIDSKFLIEHFYKGFLKMFCPNLIKKFAH